jgi:sugar lactone lactonase YvrE
MTLTGHWLLDGKFEDAEVYGHAAAFSSPRALCVDRAGVLFVCDEGNARIRRIVIDPVSGAALSVSTLIGDGVERVVDGVGTAASLVQPTAIVADPDRDVLYVGDGNCIRRIDYNLRSGGSDSGDSGGGGDGDERRGARITQWAGHSTESGVVDGIGSSARMGLVRSLALDAKDNALFFADTLSDCIRRVGPDRDVQTLRALRVPRGREGSPIMNLALDPATRALWVTTGSGGVVLFEVEADAEK